MAKTKSVKILRNFSFIVHSGGSSHILDYLELSELKQDAAETTNVSLRSFKSLFLSVVRLRFMQHATAKFLLLSSACFSRAECWVCVSVIASCVL